MRSPTSDLKADYAIPLLKIFCLQTIGKSWHIKVFTVWLQSISLSSNFSVTIDSILQTTSNICISKFPCGPLYQINFSPSSYPSVLLWIRCQPLWEISFFSPQHHVTFYISIYCLMLKQISLLI